MLGSIITKTLAWSDKLTRPELLAWDRKDLDITQQDQVLKKIRELKPDIVINATGYTDVDGAETNRELAFAVNADGVKYVAQACSQVGASLIYFSTDYVFNGTKRRGYCEDEVEHLKPINVYGKSKLEGEQQIKCQKYFIIRTSWLYGAEGKNFVDTIIQRAIEGQKEFKVVDDQFGKSTYTVDLADRVVWMIQRIEKLDAGVYHCTNRSKAGITWFEFACEIFKQAKNLGILSKIPKLIPCKTDEFPRPAQRPKYSALINTKLPEMRDWRQALGDYLTSNF